MLEMENVENVFPLSTAQKGLLYQTILAGADALYRTQSCDNVVGEFDNGIFRKALCYLMDRHESLRCLFLHEGLDEPAAIVHSKIEAPLREHDLTSLNADEQAAKLEQLVQACLDEPLELDQAPLFRITMVKLSDTLTQLIFDIHHLIFDGWSSALFFSELQVTYQAFSNNDVPDLGEAGKYSDYVAQVNQFDPLALSAHWSDKLRGFEKPTALQLDTTLGLGDQDSLYTNASFYLSLGAKEMRGLSELARITRVTLSTVVEAAWALTLARYNNTDDVVIGVTLNGRSSSLQGHERTFGLFASALPLRLKCSPRMKLQAWLAAAQREKTLLNQNEQASLADIHLASELPAGVPLFEALLVYQTFPELGGQSKPVLQLRNVGVHENSPIPLLIDIFTHEQLDFKVLYAEERLPEKSARQLMGHYLSILKSFSNIRSPEQASLHDVVMLLDDDRDLLLSQWNAPVSCEESEPVRETLHSLFLEQVERTPTLTAVKDSHTSLSYRELASAAQCVSNFLYERGIRGGDTVAICLERSTLMYPAVLGVMMVGGLFVPVDPSYPANRQNHMLSDCGARLVLSTSTAPRLFDLDNVDVVELDTHWSKMAAAPAVTASREVSDKGAGAYIMYTSGSTGMAKGVIGGHSPTINRCRWMWETYPFSNDEVCCQKTSLSFVDSIWELMGPLLQGVPTVVISDEVVQNVNEFTDVLERERVTRLVVLPSYLSVILDSVDAIADRLSALRVCVVSGEPLSATVAEQFLALTKNCQLLNLYGSTEVSGDVTAQCVSADDLVNGISIGHPIRQCQVYILDSNQQLMPPGAIGELCVAGSGLSLGYYGENDSLNRDKFLPNPFGQGKLYLTGDLGRYRLDGAIEHCGRKDAQIKIRGHRIEPVEIERVIARVDGVRAALVNAPGNNKLYAYYRVKQGASVDQTELETFVRDNLPEYMVPQAVLHIDNFPRLPNGKISRKQLPNPSLDTTVQRVLPRTDTEKKIGEIWKNVLGVTDVSVLDNFESSGGSSLTGMRFNAQVYREYGVSILPRMLLTATLAQIAAHVRPDDVIVKDQLQAMVDLIEPLYFGEQGRRLFGVLHTPSVTTSRRAVLLCSSIGHEFMRLYRGHQLLATELSRQGFHVLRFDYFGVGDSQGESHEATLTHWCQNVNAAAQLLREKSGATEITVIAVRLGAPIALNASLENVDKYILWDPVCSGEQYWNHLGKLHHFALKNLDRYRYKKYRSAPWERFGYSYSKSLASELKALHVSSLLDEISSSVYVVTTGEVVNDNQMDISSLLSHPSVKHSHLPELDLWSSFYQASYLAFVQPALKRILDLIKEKV